MAKPVQNKSEGILGAIKSVTNRPVNKVSQGKDKGPLPNVPKFENLVARKPSALVREIELSRAEQEKPGKADDSTKKPATAVLLSEEINKKQLRQNLAKPIQIEEDEFSGETRPTKRDTATRAKNQNTKAIPAIDERQQNRKSSSQLGNKIPSKVSPRTDRVLPESRPAKINQDVDRVLDSLSLDPKGQIYLTEKLRSQVSDNLLEMDLTEICEPDISIIGPVFNALQYSFHKPEMVALYGNLVSTAMSTKTARFAHPGFVDLIRNITEDEARVLVWFHKNKVLPVIDIKKVMIKTRSEMRLNTLVSSIAQLAGCEFDDLAEGYLANLERIGLLEIPRSICLTDGALYKDVLSIPAVDERLSMLNNGGKDFRGEVVRYYAKLSVYGIKFCHACLR